MDPKALSTPLPLGFWGRHEFLIRRLHSLSGLWIGGYMCVHLLTNASVLNGPGTFQDQVETIHRLGRALPLVEWSLIFIPIIFHAAVGVQRAVSCETNSSTYRYGSNFRYTLQRATAWIALFFIAWHVFHMHGWFHFDLWLKDVAEPLSGAQFDAEHATSSAATALMSPLVKVAYAIGILACVYHFANGLWTAGITWGIWITPTSQRRADFVCGGIGVVLAVVGLSALAGFGAVDRVKAQAEEDVRIELRTQSEQKAAELERELRERTSGAKAKPQKIEPGGSQ
ncbi:MAG TPA: succinate dehydrogenase cytochrome b558 subunit [Pirellulales bacterium]|nr:succinate dehydrogenase cytochrome b558 subunit [Pirellulales bacterium]